MTAAGKFQTSNTLRNLEFDSYNFPEIDDNKEVDILSFKKLKEYESKVKALQIKLEKTSMLQKHFKETNSKWSPKAISYEMVRTVEDICGGFYVYTQHAFTLEGLLVICNCCLATMVEIKYTFSRRLDFSLLGFAIVFPLTFLMQQVFSRREQALVRLSDFKSALQLLTAAHLTFIFNCNTNCNNHNCRQHNHNNESHQYNQGQQSNTGNQSDPNANDRDVPIKNDMATENIRSTHSFQGRLSLPPSFNSEVRKTNIVLVQLLYKYLSLPVVGKGSHFLFPSQQQDYENVCLSRHEIESNICLVFQRLNNTTEQLKFYGLSPPETSRLQQLNLVLQQTIGYLRNLKSYRTPYATRAFGRVYVLILPWFFGPYFGYVAGDDPTLFSQIFAVVLAVFTFIILLGLLNASRFLEDSFVQDGFDNVQLKHELANLIQNIDFQFQEAEKTRLNTKSNSCFDIFDDIDMDENFEIISSGQEEKSKTKQNNSGYLGKSQGSSDAAQDSPEVPIQKNFHRRSF
eukprot:Awhi_evm1s1789